MEEGQKAERKWRGLKWESELDETERRNGWLPALIGKSSLSPLLVNHKGVRNDFFPSKTLLHHLLLTYPPHNSLRFSIPPKAETVR